MFFFSDLMLLDTQQTTVQYRYNFYMHQETKMYLTPLLRYSIYCSGLELNLQYLRDVSVQGSILSMVSGSQWEMWNVSLENRKGLLCVFSFACLGSVKMLSLKSALSLPVSVKLLDLHPPLLMGMELGLQLFLFFFVVSGWCRVIFIYDFFPLFCLSQASLLLVPQGKASDTGSEVRTVCDIPEG